MHRLFASAPARDVVIDRPYFLCVTEVTNDQYRALMTGHEPDPLSATADSPVVDIRYAAAESFCRELSRREGITNRLPTEAEWERACRAGTTTLFSFGDSPDRLPEYGWTADRAGRGAAGVAQLKPNDWGLFDMHGNAAEWARVAQSDVAAKPRVEGEDAAAEAHDIERGEEPAGTHDGRHPPDGEPIADRGYVLRGGGWAVLSPWACTSTARTPYPLMERKPFSKGPRFGQQVGFRILREIPADKP